MTQTFHDERQFLPILMRIREEIRLVVDKLAPEFDVEQGDIEKLILAYLSWSHDQTRDLDTLVLAINGNVTPYDNALQALFGGIDGKSPYDGILDFLKSRRQMTTT